MACSGVCRKSPQTPDGEPSKQKPKRPTAAPAEGGREVVEEVEVQETFYETFQRGDEVQDKDKVLKEDLKRVHQARRKLITDIYANMPVII